MARLQALPAARVPLLKIGRKFYCSLLYEECMLDS